MSHDPFFTARRCQRCVGCLDGGRTMSMFNTQVICMACKEKEMLRPDYRDAVEAEMKAVRNGDRNFKGIGLKGGAK